MRFSSWPPANVGPPAAKRLQAYGSTAEAVAAFRAHDYLALHEALGLGPHETSPLDVTDDPANRDRYTEAGTAGWESWPAAMELRRALTAGLNPLSSMGGQNVY
ncbi:hypothetical protein M1105_03870 [Limibaculum sp. FT325]|uniref:hypothetical protein n=1 Tax=Thermohalobaculum sediminis TaxID=2939436 RepID=UPI0020C11D20|nr:hypothetical protein [Limibaculum sediminis]MCL5776134.1 hypothetical protein [Limibaculum sediminis]